MLGRTTLRVSRLACPKAMYASTTAPTIPATSGEIALPRNKEVFKPCPTSENMSQEVRDKWYPALGNRDIVGDSFSCNHDYIDDPDVPMPAVRFAANTPEVIALRQKEKGDWKSLTLEEKKQLYRSSYRATFAEMMAPTGDWKRLTYHTFYLFALALLFQIVLQRHFRKDPEPIQKMVDADAAFQVISSSNMLTGALKDYDYDNNKWK